MLPSNYLATYIDSIKYGCSFQDKKKKHILQKRFKPISDLNATRWRYMWLQKPQSYSSLRENFYLDLCKNFLVHFLGSVTHYGHIEFKKSKSYSDRVSKWRIIYLSVKLYNHWLKICQSCHYTFLYVDPQSHPL